VFFLGAPTRFFVLLRRVYAGCSVGESAFLLLAFFVSVFLVSLWFLSLFIFFFSRSTQRTGALFLHHRIISFFIKAAFVQKFRIIPFMK